MIWDFQAMGRRSAGVPWERVLFCAIVRVLTGGVSFECLNKESDAYLLAAGIEGLRRRNVCCL